MLRKENETVQREMKLLLMYSTVCGLLWYPVADSSKWRKSRHIEF
jgi:hypothetical protein